MNIRLRAARDAAQRTSNLLLATRVASCVGLVAHVGALHSCRPRGGELTSPAAFRHGFAITTQPLGIAEDALLEVRWHHDLPEVERASVRGASRRYGARYRAHRARQSSNNEPHLRAAPSAVPSNTRLLALELQNLPKRVGNGTAARHGGRYALPRCDVGRACALLHPNDPAIPRTVRPIQTLRFLRKNTRMCRGT